MAEEYRWLPGQAGIRRDPDCGHRAVRVITHVRAGRRDDLLPTFEAALTAADRRVD